jgi:hypothetical protein
MDHLLSRVQSARPFAPDHPVQFRAKHDLRQCEVNIVVIAASIMADAQKNTRAAFRGQPGCE